MDSAFKSGAIGPGSLPEQGYNVVFLHFTLCLSPPGCINGYWQI